MTKPSYEELAKYVFMALLEDPDGECQCYVCQEGHKLRRRLEEAINKGELDIDTRPPCAVCDSGLETMKFMGVQGDGYVCPACNTYHSPGLDPLAKVY